MDQEQGNETGEGRVKAKIIKHFVDQVTARWPAFKDVAVREAYIADAVSDLGPLTVAQLGETINAVRRDWEQQKFRPSVRDFRVAATKLGFFDAPGRGENSGVARGRAMAQAEAIKKSIMDNLRGNALVAEAWAMGFYREMREHIFAEALRQLLDGATQPVIDYPPALVEGWRRAADERRQADPGAMSPELRAVVDRIRETQAQRRAG